GGEGPVRGSFAAGDRRVAQHFAVHRAQPPALHLQQAGGPFAARALVAGSARRSQDGALAARWRAPAGHFGETRWVAVGNEGHRGRGAARDPGALVVETSRYFRVDRTSPLNYPSLSSPYELPPAKRAHPTSHAPGHPRS